MNELLTLMKPPVWIAWGLIVLISVVAMAGVVRMGRFTFAGLLRNLLFVFVLAPAVLLGISWAYSHGIPVLTLFILGAFVVLLIAAGAQAVSKKQ